MATFDKAIATVLQREGGYVHDPADPGGETYCGVSRRAHPGWPGWGMIDRLKSETDVAGLGPALAALPEMQTSLMDFYRREYWSTTYERIESQAVATKILDLTVNLGRERGIRLVQQALHDAGVTTVEQDGVFGPQTLQSVRLLAPETLLAAIRTRQVLQYVAIVIERPEQRKFLRGWVRRAVAALALALLCATPGSADIPPRDGPNQVNFPPCLGGERGYWQTYLVHRDDKTYVFLALTTHDYLDPSTVICWVDGAQILEARPLEKQVRDRRLEVPGPFNGRHARPERSTP